MRLKLTKTEPFICVCIYKFIAKETTDHVKLTNAHTNQMGIVFKWYISFKSAKSFFRLLIFAIQFWMSRKFKCSHVIQHKLYGGFLHAQRFYLVAFTIRFTAFPFERRKNNKIFYERARVGVWKKQQRLCRINMRFFTVTWIWHVWQHRIIHRLFFFVSDFMNWVQASRCIANTHS